MVSRSEMPAGHKAVGPGNRLRVGSSRLPPVFAATKDRPSQAYPTAQGSTTRCRCPGGSRAKDSGHARATIFSERCPRGQRAPVGNRMVAAMWHQGSTPCLSARIPWIAQQAEQRVDNAQVLRSIRSPRTTSSPVSSIGRIPVSKTGGGGSSPSRGARDVVQRPERLLHTQDAGGSIPPVSTNIVSYGSSRQSRTPYKRFGQITPRSWFDSTP